MTTTMRRILWIVALVVVLIAGLLWISRPLEQRGSFTPVGNSSPGGQITDEQHSFTPVAIQLVSDNKPVAQPGGKITTERHRFTVLPTTTSPTTPTRATNCQAGSKTFGMKGITIGENADVADIVHGVVVMHFCQGGGAKLHQIQDAWFSTDHYESWLWGLASIDIQQNHTGWSDQYRTYYHYWRVLFRWERGVVIAGQPIVWHWTSFIACTGRAGVLDRDRWDCSAGVP